MNDVRMIEYNIDTPPLPRKHILCDLVSFFLGVPPIRATGNDPHLYFFPFQNNTLRNWRECLSRGVSFDGILSLKGSGDVLYGL
jgi:hypothetical protein